MPPVLPEKLPVQRIRTGSVLYRAHSNTRQPLYFGPDPGDPPTHRFHAPGGSYRTCFLGRSEEAAFAEGVLHGPIPTQIVARATIEARGIAVIHVVEPIRVLPLYGEYLMRAGATAAVTHGDDYAVSQGWGKAIYDHPLAFDAILYTSRHDDSTFSLALFDRARHKVVAGASRRLSVSDLRTLLLLTRYGIGLV